MTVEEFYNIESGVKGVIANSFVKASQVSQADFILLMARGGYHKHLDEKDIDVSPFVLEDRLDFLMDRTRRKFFENYLNEYIDKLKGNRNLSNEDREYEVNIQMMVYTHIWESHIFLNQLSRLALVQLGKGYQWKDKIPHDGKANFINDSIIRRFEQSDGDMANLIKSCYSTDMRNAFAHSSYYVQGNQIRLNKDGFFAGASISFEAWDAVFVRSMLLSYLLNDMLLEKKNHFIDEYGDGPVLIEKPIKYHHNKRKSAYIKPVRTDDEEEKVRFRFATKEVIGL
jgi:hypothetical protein